MRSLIVAAFLVASASSLKCYQAASLNQNYKPLENETRTCQPAATMCFKAMQNSKDAGGNKIKTVIFDCSPDWSNSVGDICHGIASGKCSTSGGINFCCCSGDRCNAAPAKIILLVPILAFFFYFLKL